MPAATTVPRGDSSRQARCSVANETSSSRPSISEPGSPPEVGAGGSIVQVVHVRASCIAIFCLR